MPSTIQCLEIIFESFVYIGTSSKMLKDHLRDAKYDDSVQAKSRDYSQQPAKSTPCYITTNPEARETLTCLARLIKKIKT